MTSLKHTTRDMFEIPSQWQGLASILGSVALLFSKWVGALQLPVYDHKGNTSRDAPRPLSCPILLSLLDLQALCLVRAPVGNSELDVLLVNFV